MPELWKRLKEVGGEERLHLKPSDLTDVGASVAGLWDEKPLGDQAATNTEARPSTGCTDFVLGRRLLGSVPTIRKPWTRSPDTTPTGIGLTLWSSKSSVSAGVVAIPRSLFFGRASDIPLYPGRQAAARHQNLDLCQAYSSGLGQEGSAVPPVPTPVQPWRRRVGAT